MGSVYVYAPDEEDFSTIGICGELGADLELTELFLSIGLDELSVSPRSVLPLRQKVRETEVAIVKEKLINVLMNDENEL